MTEEAKMRAASVFNIVESVILALSVGVIAWTCKTVIEHGNTLSSQGTMIAISTGRIESLESRGSRSLETHVKEDDARIEDLKARVNKLETAILVLSTLPGDIKALDAKMQSLHEGQARIEKTIEQKINK